MMLGLILALSAGCAAAPRQSPTFEPRKRPDLENIPQASLTIGQEKHLRLKDVDIDANLLLTEQPDFYQLELKLAVPGDWERSVGWDEKELSARLLFENGSESKGWNSSVEGLSWGGCLHGWRTQATLRFWGERVRPNSRSGDWIHS
jgi:hypothetical protein